MPAHQEPPPGPTPPLDPRPKVHLVVLQQASNIPAVSKDSTKAALTTANELNSPLLRLPPRALKLVYAKIFTTPDTIELMSWNPHKYQGGPTHRQQISNPFSALFVCRKLFVEGNLVVYANNTFHCSNTWDLNICLERLRPAQQTAIKTILLRWYTGQAILLDAKLASASFRSADAVLRSLAGLTTIIINADGRTFFDKHALQVDLEEWVIDIGRKDVKIVVRSEAKKEERRQDVVDASGQGTLADVNKTYQAKWGPKNVPRKPLRKTPLLPVSQLRRPGSGSGSGAGSGAGGKNSREYESKPCCVL